MSKFTWDHIHLKTSDPEKMAQWFAKMFDAELVRSIFYGKPRVDVKIGGVFIFIADSDDAHNPAPQIPYRGLEHFGLQVTGIDEIAADLKAKGWNLRGSRPRCRGACACASCADRRVFRSSCSTAPT